MARIDGDDHRGDDEGESARSGLLRGGRGANTRDDDEEGHRGVDYDDDEFVDNVDVDDGKR